ncbi:MAG TPA: cobalt ECF transporter T component CbiQ [Methanothermococcus okinawensis]|uniref:Cobalt ECF transporter T component CbiQ n=1 Tax=Methanothermococcus okinawensis TaxID=155863 RepID=A0A832ZJT6_9EURY|nr:cobalt ECF transporter T component CbiQ [Methanococcaceae archaeon]HIP84926.1 cobalt ECF transporter T component CbiQ [Methanothermococcus okinawensis]HIP91173.1 cobalt ECF transporter T component CbiQ [Methanothermococcus okinawensis]
MNANIIDRIAHNNRLRHINPKLKVFFALSMLLITVFSKSVIVPLIIALIMIVLTVFVAKVPLRIYLPLLLAPLGFGVITVILMGIIYSGGKELLSIKIFNFTISIYSYGVNLGLLVFSRMLGGIACTLFLALTTPMTELFYILRDLKLPSTFVDIAMMMYRYIFLLLEEMIRITNAQNTRLGYKDLKTTYKSLGTLGAILFIRAWDRGEKAFITMSCRGYNGDLKLIKKIESPAIKYILLIVIVDILLIALSYLTGDFKVIT